MLSGLKLLVAAASLIAYCSLVQANVSDPQFIQAYKSRFMPSPQQTLPTYSYGNFVGGISNRCHVSPSLPPPASSTSTASDDLSHYPPGAAFAVGIVSAIENRSRRDAIRRTWLTLPAYANPPLPPGTFEYAFFLGLDEKREIPAHIVAEMNEFHDIVVVDTIDTYRNMIYKVVSLFTWGSRSCGASYVLRANDDVYLNLFGLFRSLLKEVPVNLYCGYFLTDVKVLRPAQDSLASPPSSKSSAVPFSVYPSDVYPVFAQGNAYVLSRDLAEVVAGLADEPWRRLFADDILVGLLMDGRRVRKAIIPSDFAPDGGRNECKEESDFQFDVGVEAMDIMYFNDLNGRPHCEGVEVLF